MSYKRKETGFTVYCIYIYLYKVDMCVLMSYSLSSFPADLENGVSAGKNSSDYK